MMKIRETPEDEKMGCEEARSKRAMMRIISARREQPPISPPPQLKICCSCRSSRDFCINIIQLEVKIIDRSASVDLEIKMQQPDGLPALNPYYDPEREVINCMRICGARCTVRYGRNEGNSRCAVHKPKIQAAHRKNWTHENLVPS